MTSTELTQLSPLNNREATIPEPINSIELPDGTSIPTDELVLAGLQFSVTHGQIDKVRASAIYNTIYKKSNPKRIHPGHFE